MEPLREVPYQRAEEGGPGDFRGAFDNRAKQILRAFPVGDITGGGQQFFWAALRVGYNRQTLLEQLTSAVAVAMDDCLAHHDAEARHPSGQPVGNLPAVQRQIGASSPTSHQWDIP